MTTMTTARLGTIARSGARRAGIRPESPPVRNPTAPGIVRGIETVRIEVGPLTIVAANVPGEAQPRVCHLTLRSAAIATSPLPRTLEGRS